MAQPGALPPEIPLPRWPAAWLRCAGRALTSAAALLVWACRRPHRRLTAEASVPWPVRPGVSQRTRLHTLLKPLQTPCSPTPRWLARHRLGQRSRDPKSHSKGGVWPQGRGPRAGECGPSLHSLHLVRARDKPVPRCPPQAVGVRECKGQTLPGAHPAVPVRGAVTPYCAPGHHTHRFGQSDSAALALWALSRGHPCPTALRVGHTQAGPRERLLQPGPGHTPTTLLPPAFLGLRDLQEHAEPPGGPQRSRPLSWT